MRFDPSRGVRAHSSQEYQRLLSYYTDNQIRPYTNGKNYKVLAERAIVAGQRWNKIPFPSDDLLPAHSIPLPYYDHYIPGVKYTESQLKSYYQHYNVKSVAELDDVHLELELYYPLDPSYVELVKWLKSEAPTEVIQRLCEMFEVSSKNALFKYYYHPSPDMVIDEEINLEVLLEEPERLFSDDEVPERSVKTLTEVTPAPSLPPPTFKQEYPKLLPSIPLTPEDSSVSRIIEQTLPKSEARRSQLEQVDTINLRLYIDRQRILTMSDSKVDMVKALQLVKGTRLLPLREEGFDYDRISTYSLTELQKWSKVLGLGVIESDDSVSLANNLYLVQVLPSFFNLTKTTVAYGTPSTPLYDEYLLDELVKLFTTKLTTSHDIPFNSPALRRLSDELPPYSPLEVPLREYLASEPSPASNLHFLRQLPLTPIQVGESDTTYHALSLQLLQLLYSKGVELEANDDEDPETVMSDFLDLVEVAPSLITSAITELPMRDKDGTVLPYNIQEAYNRIADGLSVEGVGAKFASTADYYLREVLAQWKSGKWYRFLK